MSFVSIERELSPRTIAAYRSDLRQFVHTFGDGELSEIDRFQLREYFENLRRVNHYRSTTLFRKIASLRAMWSYLEANSSIDANPARRLRFRQGARATLPVIFSRTEIRCILATPAGDALSWNESPRRKKLIGVFRAERNRAIVELLFATGIRVGELARLDISHIQWDEGRILVLGKGGRERIVFLANVEVAESLRRYLRLRDIAHPKCEALFLNKFGLRLSVYSIEKEFKSLCRRAKIARRVTPHQVRHTVATMLLENGADIKSVQEILGHASISTTEVYLHVSSLHIKKALVEYGERNRMSVTALT